MRSFSLARRAAFMSGAAITAVAALASPALAQSGADVLQETEDELTGRPGFATELPHDGPIRPPLIDVNETPSITINNNFTPAQAFDPVNVNGIGQIVTDAGGGFIGLCTGSLINPRTVIFAAHCVNNSAATSYGANSGGTGIAIGFETNTRANGPGQTDELVRWLLGQGPTQAGRFQSNEAQAFYNMLQLFWNPASRSTASCTAPTSCFIEADIAIGVLDTPARNVPTWTLLFSPLTSPASINPANGTGYHVTLTGYGRNGNGTTGAVGNDFRRRVAENMLGALTSINERNLFLFGTTGTPSRPQLLYWTDFDDPARGTATANVRDFNGFRDNALPREGATGPGDSGGPLIIDQAFSRPTIIGVLSGGSTFFAGQPGGSYGSQSFYQPLFLYWEWIVANNPYRYATANAGNRNWEDPTTWVTTLDPAYQILAGGNLVNGLPTELGGATTALTPQFGEVCFQSPLNTPAPPAVNECQNLATGAARNNVPNTPTGTGDASAPLTVQIADGAEAGAPEVRLASGATVNSARSGVASGRLDITDSADSAHDGEDVAIGDTTEVALAGEPSPEDAAPGYRDGPLPAPTLANGLPGATNFVPNNSDGVRATGVSARYYDVTLRNAGTVTLSSAVTIDRFGIAANGAGLNITTAGSLTSIIDITQMAGTMTVNGQLRSSGDYALIGGLLTGSGTVTTPFLTSVLGAIAPGGVGTIGTLTISGNVVLSTGSQRSIDLGANGVSDLLRTTPNGTSTGLITLGGLLGLNTVSRATFGNTYTVVQAAGGRTGTFTAVTDITGVLFPVVTYTANAVNVRIDAVPYVTFINAGSPAQLAFARLLDANRPNYAALSDLFGELDVLPQNVIQAQFEQAAPRTEATLRSLYRMTTDAIGRFYRERISYLGTGEAGGTLTMIGNPVQFAANRASGNAMGAMTASDFAGQDMVTREGRLPENMSGFLALGYLDGRSDPLPGLVTTRDWLEGFYISAGLEMETESNGQIGLALHYLSAEGRPEAAQDADARLYQATLYARQALGESGLAIDTQISVGAMQADTVRNVAIGGTVQRLRANRDGFAFSGESGLSYRADLGGLTLTPRAALRTTLIDFGDSRENGGSAAFFTFVDDIESVQGRIGADLGGNLGGVQPRLTAAYVHEFEDPRDFVNVAFANTAAGPFVSFALPTSDRDWFELGGALRINTPTVSFDFSADTTLGRGDLRYQTYRVGATFRF